MSLASPVDSLLRGALRPRVELIPPSVLTYGPNFGELMARARKSLLPWQQDSVDIIGSIGEDGLWACPEHCEWCSRQNGKGVIGEARALGGFFLLDEELISWSAHEYKTAMEAFRRVRTLIRRLGTSINENLVRIDEDVVVAENGSPVLVKISNTNGEESFERLDTEQRIKFIARSKGSGRGFTGWCTILDEAFALTAEHEDALAPTELAVPNPQTLYLSSPPLTGETGEIMFTLRGRAAAGEESLGYRDWGMAGDLDNLDGIDLDDPLNWAAHNPSLGSPRLTLTNVAKLRRRMRSRGGRGFARECLGIWPAVNLGGGAIDMKRWADLLDEDSKRVGDLALGVDIAPDRSSSSIGLYGPRADELGHLQLIDSRDGTAWLVDRIVELRTGLAPIAIGMGRGTYASLKTDLENVRVTVSEDLEKPKRGDLVVLGGTEMAAACGQMIDAVKDGTLRIKPDPDAPERLDDAAAGAQTKQGVDSIAWARLKAGTDISPLVAATEARWTYLSRVDSLAAPPAASANNAPKGDNSALWRPTQRLSI